MLFIASTGTFRKPLRDFNDSTDLLKCDEMVENIDDAIIAFS